MNILILPGNWKSWGYQFVLFPSTSCAILPKFSLNLAILPMTHVSKSQTVHAKIPPKLKISQRFLHFRLFTYILYHFVGGKFNFKNIVSSSIYIIILLL